MAFILPAFNLSCDIYTGPWLTKAFRLNVFGNLARGRRTAPVLGVVDPGFDISNVSATLLLPPLTDIRDQSCGPDADFVEVPSGSGRWYGVQLVDDVGKGFLNEHRFALLAKTAEVIDPVRLAGSNWPTPIP